jgi:hypothetical protein
MAAPGQRGAGGSAQAGEATSVTGTPSGAVLQDPAVAPPPALRPTLNSDGQRHPVMNAVTLLVFAAGIAAFAFGLIVKTHLLATILGMAAFGGGLIAQMLSDTREQRILIMAGVVAGFVGMGLAIAHGGFG